MTTYTYSCFERAGIRQIAWHWLTDLCVEVCDEVGTTNCSFPMMAERRINTAEAEIDLKYPL